MSDNKKTKSKELYQKHKEYHKKYRETHKQQRREYDKKWRKTHKEWAREYWKKLRKSKKLRYIVKDWARNRSQHLPKKDKCEFCPSTNNLQKHHMNYCFPEIYVTVCPICHKTVHKTQTPTVWNSTYITIMEEETEPTILEQPHKVSRNRNTSDDKRQQGDREKSFF